MHPREPVIRLARPGDAEGIARVHVDSWRETYTGLVPDRYFDDDAYRSRVAMWSRFLALDPPPGTLVVAERERRIIGFASAGAPARPDAMKGHPPSRDLHLYAIYLLAAEQGTGIGRALLDAALGPAPAQLWVLKANARARAFYERNGFRADGVIVVDPDLDDATEIRMVR